jgi:hypothetical protein
LKGANTTFNSQTILCKEIEKKKNKKAQKKQNTINLSFALHLPDAAALRSSNSCATRTGERFRAS